MQVLNLSKGLAQEFNFRHLSVNEGLSQSAVFCVTQDSAGYIWVGTADGLNRYNGYEFIHFRNRPGDPNSISDNFIYCMSPAKDGGVWVGTFGGGLNHFNPADNTFKRWLHTGEKGEISHNDVYSIYQTDSQLFVGTYQGLDVSTDLQAFTPINLPDYAYFRTHQVLQTSKGKVLVAHDFGVSMWDRKTNLLTLPGDDFKIFEEEAITAYCLYEFGDGEIWVGTDNGILVYSKNLEYIKTITPATCGFSQTEITSIYQDNSQNIWIGSNGEGVCVFTQSTHRFLHFEKDPGDEFSLSDNVVTSVFQDPSGVVWIGTYHGGINKYDRYINQFRLYQYRRNEPEGLGAQRVFALLENDEGDVWVGTDGGGLDLVDHHFDQNGVIVSVAYQHFTDLFDHEKIWSIKEDSDKNLWIGTIGHGLICFNPDTKAITNYRKDSSKEAHQTLSDDSIYALLFDSKGRLWIGTDVGLNCMDIHTGSFKHFAINPDEVRTFSSNTVLALEEDKDGHIWAGTFGGGITIIDYDKGVVEQFTHKMGDTSSLSYDKVMSIFRDSENRIWVGTFGGGFNLYNDKDQTFHAYTELDGLPNDVVYGFLEDKSGYLWMSTNKGLSAFNIKTGNFRNFDESCNLQSNEFNQGAYSMGPSGRFYFGGINGFNSFIPDEANINHFKPPVDIIAYTKPGELIWPQIVDGKKHILLDYSENNIFFEYVAFSYVNSHLNKYRYKLEGLSEEWIEAENRRSAGYTNLDPGEYIFKVQASNNDGVWNTHGGSITIKVKSPVYLMWWFQPLLFFISLGLITLIAYLIVKTVRNNTKRQLVEADLRLSEAEKEGFKYRLTSLRAQMDPHFIFNSLNSIQHFISQNDKDAARGYLTKFATLMRLILNSSREEMISLAEEIDTLRLYIDLEKLRFDHKFTYSIYVSDEIDADEVEIPTMLMQPFVENAIIHGLKNKPTGEGLLSIEATKVEGGILVVIEDNGIGRAKAKEIKEQKQNRYKSLGMQVTQDRLSLWSNSHEQPTVKITDLYDENNAPAGTRVEIFIRVSIFD